MTAGAALFPNFHAMPRELCSIPRWVMWKGAKVPYCATALKSKASVNEPNTWATFSQAQTAFEEGGYLGVGFVLAGDGIVGIDLDKCVDSGTPEPAAMGLLDRLGCKYIEFSPSGTGLHGFGYGNLTKGTRGKIDGINAELYASGRYLTVTGNFISNGPLVQLPGLAEVANAIRSPHLQKSTEEVRSNSLSSSVGLFSSVGFPRDTIPSGVGQRHMCLFNLARHMKTGQPHATRTELREIAQVWHSQFLLVIGTKEFSITLTDFLIAFEKVRHPHGAIMQSILSTIDPSAPLPSGIEDLKYGGLGQQLIRICCALQSHQGDDPFFLSARKAGELLGIHFTDASKILSAMVGDSVLTLVSKGVGKSASRYRFSWKQ